MDIFQILEQYKERPFIQRILERANTGKSAELQNTDGSISTHSMAWSSIEREGKEEFIVYPTVIAEEQGRLKRLEDKEAINNALQNNNYISFDSSEAAAEFSKKYKDIWAPR